MNMHKLYDLTNEPSKPSSRGSPIFELKTQPRMNETPRNRKESEKKEKVRYEPEERSIYLLVSNFPPELYPKVVKEFEQFGEIKDIYSLSGANWILIEYSNPENVKIAKLHYNPYRIDPFIKNLKMTAEILNEDDKDNFLRMNVREEGSLVDYNERGCQGSFATSNFVTSDTVPNYNIPNTAYLTLQAPKSKFQKFLEVFLNL